MDEEYIKITELSGKPKRGGIKELSKWGKFVRWVITHLVGGEEYVKNLVREKKADADLKEAMVETQKHQTEKLKIDNKKSQIQVEREKLELQARELALNIDRREITIDVDSIDVTERERQIQQLKIEFTEKLKLLGITKGVSISLSEENGSKSDDIVDKFRNAIRDYNKGRVGIFKLNEDIIIRKRDNYLFLTCSPADEFDYSQILMNNGIEITGRHTTDKGYVQIIFSE